MDEVEILRRAIAATTAAALGDRRLVVREVRRALLTALGVDDDGQEPAAGETGNGSDDPLIALAEQVRDHPEDAAKLILSTALAMLDLASALAYVAATLAGPDRPTLQELGLRVAARDNSAGGTA